MKYTRPAFPDIRRGLAGKLALCLVVSTAVIFTIFGWINLNTQRRTSEELLVQSADRISDIILRSTSYQMLHNDREALYQSIRAIGSEPGLKRIRIFNKEGRISFSTEASEINRVVDKQAEACYACHAKEAALEKLERPDRERIFEEDGNRVLGMIRPIENRPECANAACHYHPASQRILGVVDVNLTLQAVDQRLAATHKQLIGFTALAVLAICAVSILFIWAFVYKPIHRLMDGTHRVADGDLTHRLEVTSGDELGDLAASFNKMTAELAQAHREITDWAHTLEVRVDRKTQELERAHVSLVRSEKMASLGKLAATVAHEVNNPLFGILTYSRLCLKDLERAGLAADQGGRMAERLKLIENESRRCGDIIRNLLTFARQAPSQRAENNLNELLERALLLVRHQLDLQSIELSRDLAPDMPPILCDAGQIQQVALVLFVNAAEAMGTGGHLYVRSRYDEAADSVVITVRDNGPGIPAQVAAQIFDPFFTTKDDKLRTGLGLAVARSIVEQHAGSISVSSKPGEGAEFTITLPREAPAPAAAPNPMEAAVAAGNL